MRYLYSVPDGRGKRPWGLGGDDRMVPAVGVVTVDLPRTSRGKGNHDQAAAHRRDHQHRRRSRDDVLGAITYYVVHRELADEHIVVADDAQHNAGKDVEGPFTAYSQAMVIKTHALEAGGGKTYAELPQGDPARQTVMTASFLRASLFTSVVAFGVAALVVGLGVMFILLGLGFLGLLSRYDPARRANAPPIDEVLPAPDEVAPSTSAQSPPGVEA